jgi:hypothetical protein
MTSWAPSANLLRIEERQDVLSRGVDLVERLIAYNVAPEALAGIGRWYGVDGLDDTRWTQLNLEVVRRGTVFREAGMVARRAARSVTTDTFNLLKILLETSTDPWAPRDIAEAALSAMQLERGQSEQRDAMRTALLERGYFAARNL